MEENEYKYVEAACFLEDLSGVMTVLRKKQGLTIDELANKCEHVPVRTLTNFSAERRYLPGDKLTEIFDALGYNLIVFAVKKEDAAR
jgi:hypothetical protein